MPRRVILISLVVLSFYSGSAAWSNAGDIEFDVEALRLAVPSLAQIDPSMVKTIRVKPKKDNPRDSLNPVERNLAMFVDVFNYFMGYALQFDERKDSAYPIDGDVRLAFTKDVSNADERVALQVEAYRTTLYNEVVRIQSYGGGAGVRVDLHPTENGIFSASFLPLYGEKRTFNAYADMRGLGKQYMMRSGIGAAYKQKLGTRLEPGVQMLFQPQWIDFGQYRIYAEAYFKVKVAVEEKTGLMRTVKLSDVSLVPKVIFWNSTDVEGLFGDPIQQFLGELSSTIYSSLDRNLYGFLNLEFHFHP
jgi:hypothetical protein